ncbi:MAG: hypothetical protein R3E48_14575 [Burkholderiaceae bacterium]
MKIAFVIMSAVQRPDTVAQLARALAPHTVVIHHDFSQQPDFPVDEPNVVFVPNPCRTGWAIWGYSLAVLNSVRYCLQEIDFDYLQILSPTCLPIRPISEFEDYIRNSGVDANIECLDFARIEVSMTAGFRAFAPDHSLRYKVLGRLMSWYVGENPELLDVAGVQLRMSHAVDARGRLPLKGRVARRIMTWAQQGRLWPTYFNDRFRAHYGTSWFGASRKACEAIIARCEDPALIKYFSGLIIADEVLFPSLFANSGLRLGPLNHYVSKFIESRPAWLTEDDIDTLRASGRFFARKFADDPDAPVRARVLDELVHHRARNDEHPHPEKTGA